MFANAFKNVRQIEYDGKTIDNVFKNVYTVFDRVFANGYSRERYTIEGSPTAPELAGILYEDVELYWVFFILNNIVNVYDDWLLSDSQVYTMAVDLWGDDINNIHHYEATTGEKFYDVVENNNVWYDVGDTGFTTPFYTGTLTPVTNLQYLINLNEEKRQIDIIPPEQISQFVDELKRNLVV